MVFERVFMEVLLAASSAALPTDAGRFTQLELHESIEDLRLYRSFEALVQ